MTTLAAARAALAVLDARGISLCDLIAAALVDDTEHDPDLRASLLDDEGSVEAADEYCGNFTDEVSERLALWAGEIAAL